MRTLPMGITFSAEKTDSGNSSYKIFQKINLHFM